MSGLTRPFLEIRNRLAARCGLYLDESRVPQLTKAVADRMAARQLSHVSDYDQLLRSEEGAEELRLLAELLVNHETFFFRNRPHFRALRESILPELHQRYPAGRPIRCWSAGCSTGEEPYSLAITALEVFGMPPVRTTKICATDISLPALQRATAGVYRGRSLTNVTPTQLATYFQPAEGGYRVRPEVQSLITFQQLNLLDPFPAWAKGIDLIFCQNVTIYFQLATSRELISRFYDALADGGYLFLGFSETLWGIFDRFETVELDGAFAYRKNVQHSAARPAPKVKKPEPPPPHVRSAVTISRRTIDDAGESPPTVSTQSGAARDAVQRRGGYPGASASAACRRPAAAGAGGAAAGSACRCRDPCGAGSCRLASCRSRAVGSGGR
ncbi:MAG: hypothetical protein KatS3mg057_2336 [Herpetosiphonaceae bacterium]|nr:MAG: hypothetical protein KatS3mg057_2336 [Herpetosiphonaceae bacterium]